MVFCICDTVNHLHSVYISIYLGLWKNYLQWTLLDTLLKNPALMVTRSQVKSHLFIYRVSTGF